MEEVAMRLQVTKRTLRSWKLKAKNKCNRRSGRPSVSFATKRRALILVAREMKKQGYPGSPAIAIALKGEVSLRLVRMFVKSIKTHRNKMIRQMRIENRISVKVQSSNVVWAQDGTHLGRINGHAVEAQIIKDRGSQKVLAVSTGYAACGSEIVSMMKNVKKNRPLPLVWMTDNGAAYLSKEVRSFLDNEKVIHLKSMPHVPQHNGAAEKMMCELKNLSLVGKKVCLRDMNMAHEEIASRAEKVNSHRRRMSLNFKTSNECDEQINKVDVNTIRDRFFDEYSQAMKGLCLIKNKALQRKMEREIVMSLLEINGLIKRTRSGEECVA